MFKAESDKNVATREEDEGDEAGRPPQPATTDQYTTADGPRPGFDAHGNGVKIGEADTPAPYVPPPAFPTAADRAGRLGWRLLAPTTGRCARTACWPMRRQFSSTAPSARDSTPFDPTPGRRPHLWLAAYHDSG